MIEKIRFTSSDAWLLHAIFLAANKDEATLEGIVAAADFINHAMLTFDEIDCGLGRLSRAGLISIADKRVRITAAASEMLKQVEMLHHFDAMDELETLLEIPKSISLPLPVDPEWRIGAFTASEVKEAKDAYRQKFRDADRQVRKVMFMTKLVTALVLLAMAGACGFGFVATFEPQGFIGWRIGYTVIGLTCLAAGVWLLIPRWSTKSAHGHRS